MHKMWVWSLGWEDPLEKEMATHSDILAWEVHGQRNLAGSWDHKRAGHALATKQQQQMISDVEHIDVLIGHS